MHTLGMKFPIDVAFLSGERVVVRVAQLKPWRLAVGGRAARSAGETEAGALERWGVRVGDQLEVREVSNGVWAAAASFRSRIGSSSWERSIRTCARARCGQARSAVTRSRASRSFIWRTSRKFSTIRS